MGEPPHRVRSKSLGEISDGGEGLRFIAENTHPVGLCHCGSYAEGGSLTVAACNVGAEALYLASIRSK